MTTHHIEVEPVDTARSEAFGGRMVPTMNAAATALMTSVGHRTGLFDTMADLPPATAASIAEAAGLEERYVREWLGALRERAGGKIAIDTPPDPKTGAWVQVLDRLDLIHAVCLRPHGPGRYRIGPYPRIHSCWRSGNSSA